MLFRSGRSLREELDVPASAVVLLYAGTMGGAQGLDSLVRAAAEFDRSRLVLLMAGSGTHEDGLRALTKRLRADSVQFLGRRPPEEMPDLYATSDICYASLNDHPLARMTMPSKIQATLASGKPLLVAARGDAREVALSSGAGFGSEPENVSSLVAALREILAEGRPALSRRGVTAREFYQSTFSLETGVSRVEDALSHAVRSRGDRS